MSIALRYDPAADRIRLVLRPDGQAMRVFWLRRNQCLALLARLGGAARRLGVEARPIEPLKTPPRPPRKDPEVDAATPDTLQSVRVAVDGDQVRVAFVQGDDALGLTLGAPGLQRLQELLGTQAERAGWDPAAALARMAAMARARAAIARSRASDGTEPR